MLARSRKIVAAVAALALLSGAALAQSVSLSLPQGAPDSLRADIEAASLLFSLQAGEEGASTEEYVASAAADYRRILTALYAGGFYGGTISIRIDGREAAAIPPLGAPARIGAITIEVVPGPAFVFGRAEVLPLAPGTTLPATFATGETAASGAVRRAVNVALDAWREAGHAKAEAGEQQITAHHPQARLDVAVTLRPGPELNFGRLIAEGNEAVRTERVLAIANLRSGHRFSPSDLDRAARRLRESGAFSSVSLREADTPNADGTLDIIARLAEREPRRLSFGAEISSTEGLSLTGFWLHRNLLGGAEALRLGLDITNIASDQSGTDYALSAAFSRQATISRDLDFSANARLARLDEPDYLLESFEIATGFAREIFFDGFKVSAGPGFVTAHEVTPFRDRTYTLITVPMSASLDRRDDALNATRGFYIDLDLTPFYGVEGSESGLRVAGEARLYRRLGERLVLAARGQAGAVFGANIFDAPADYLFYSGGGGTVRGQPYHALGVNLLRDFGDGPVQAERGGALFAGLQSEARVAVSERFGAVVFADAGLVGPDPMEPEFNDWHAGGGFGIRYNTAIGPIRLDIGTPLTGDDAFGAVEVYLGIGQAF